MFESNFKGGEFGDASRNVECIGRIFCEILDNDQPFSRRGVDHEQVKSSGIPQLKIWNHNSMIGSVKLR